MGLEVNVLIRCCKSFQHSNHMLYIPSKIIHRFIKYIQIKYTFDCDEYFFSKILKADVHNVLSSMYINIDNKKSKKTKKYPPYFIYLVI